MVPDAIRSFNRTPPVWDQVSGTLKNLAPPNREWPLELLKLSAFPGEPSNQKISALPTGGLPYPVNSRRRHRISISITLIRHHPFGARPFVGPSPHPPSP